MKHKLGFLFVLYRFLQNNLFLIVKLAFIDVNSVFLIMIFVRSDFYIYKYVHNFAGIPRLHDFVLELLLM